MCDLWLFKSLLATLSLLHFLSGWQLANSASPVGKASQPIFSLLVSNFFRNLKKLLTYKQGAISVLLVRNFCLLYKLGILQTNRLSHIYAEP